MPSSSAGGAPFGFLKSRHHCRECGRSCCSAHSSGRRVLPHRGIKRSVPERVCDYCSKLSLSSVLAECSSANRALQKAVDAQILASVKMARTLRAFADDCYPHHLHYHDLALEICAGMIDHRDAAGFLCDESTQVKGAWAS